MKLGTCDQYIR